ncbi:MAG: DNA polymerase/3'-5' exonuclease PolX [Desulfobacteraceae bacterium]|nr:DNA polymerase/3'-5' exonuclease PolX [Desulfobacteraceae bacterium]
MPATNSDIVEIFNRMADLLEIGGDNPFRVRAYRTAAWTVAALPHNVTEMLARGEDLRDLPGIGKDLAGKIAEICRTGTLPDLAALERRTPAALVALMKTAGLGPKRIKMIYDQLGITTVEELHRAAAEGRISALRGFGQKIERQILEGTGQPPAAERLQLIWAEEKAEAIAAHLRGFPGIDRIMVAGSYRRRAETVGDLDILATCEAPEAVMDRFTKYGGVSRVLARGETRSTVIVSPGVQVDLRVVPAESFGAALHYFTGSKAHNIAVRKLGVRRKLKINEYGVFRGDERVGGRTEEEVFGMVGLPFIEPELRENRGEVEAAAAGRLPKLIALTDIRGDLHAHTTATDGRNTLEEMAAAARERGYEYLAITEHSKRVSMAHGFDAARLAARNEEIDRLNETFDGFRLLKSIEVDILRDGSLDLPDSILGELDLVVASVHYQQNLSREEQTGRILRAMDNPWVDIVGHPTGRLINERLPYEVDMERLMAAAAARGCCLELNAHPDRLDLNDVHCKMAKDMGVKIAISTDSHNLGNLEFMRFGVGQARRGWLEKEDVINTRPWPEMRKLLRRRK